MDDLRKYWLQFLILFGLFTGWVLIEYYSPKPQDWTPSFAKDDKIPYGNYVLYRMLPDFFSESDIQVNEYSFFEADEGLLDGNSNLIMIANNFYRMDSIDNVLLLDHVARGGNVFMASNGFSELLTDTLEVQINSNFSWFTDTTLQYMNFTNPQLAADSGYLFPKNFLQYYFEDKDSLDRNSLGTTSRNRVNYIRVPFGKGSFFLHCQPVLFTNYNILYKDNVEYIERALSYLPNRRTIWDEYHHYYAKKKQTPLRYILSQPALSSAFVLLLVVMGLFILFKGKRVQRIIPIISPPKNHSLEFITTIGRLYFHRRDNKNLAEKKFAFLSEHLRNKFHINIQETKLEDAHAIAQRLDMRRTLVEKLFAHYNIIRSKNQIDNEGLIAFSLLIEDFYQQLTD